MFSAIRRRVHLSPATAIATLALVFAMSGGAYAASKYVITSTKQISPKVLKSLQGKAGAAGKNGANGANGVNGATGPQGPAGATGAQGAQGPAGTAGAAGENGAPGKEGSPWTAGGTLPSGQSETGTWAFKEDGIVAISFPIRLEGSLAAAKTHFVTVAQAEKHEVTACPGTVAEPTAEAGNLCAYEGFMDNATAAFFFAGQTSSQGAAAAGAILTFNVSATPGIGMGTWAVTAE
jgi:hypothetical protein